PATTGAHASASTESAATSAGTSLTATRPALTGARPLTRLEPRELFLRDAIDHHGHYLLVSVGSATHHDVVTDLQIFQCKFLGLLLALHALAEASLIVHHHSLRGPIGLLDLEAID